jgi:hypothetical protein
MKRLLIVMGLLVAMVSCDPTERFSYDGWKYVGSTPEGGNIYKKHFDAEHVTVYYMYGRYGSMSVVKD